jgi:hypothetical protein
MKRLEKEGFTIPETKNPKGADNKLVAFVHPKGNERRTCRVMSQNKE